MAAATTSLLSPAPPSSNVALILTLDNPSMSGINATVSALLSGAIRSTSPSGTWMLNFTAFLGVGTSDVWARDVYSLGASSSAGGSLRKSLTETDLTWRSGTGPANVDSRIGRTSYGTIALASNADGASAAYGKATQLYLGSDTPQGSSISASESKEFNLTNPLSLTLVVDIAHFERSATSFDFDVLIPLPGALALLSSALLGLATLTRLRRA